MNEEHGSGVTIEAPTSEHDAAVAAQETAQVKATAEAAVEIAEIQADVAVEQAEAIAETVTGFEAEVRAWLAQHGDPTHSELRERIANLEGLVSSLQSQVATLTIAEVIEEEEGDGAASGEASLVEPEPTPSEASEPAPNQPPPRRYVLV